MQFRILRLLYFPQRPVGAPSGVTKLSPGLPSTQGMAIRYA